MAARSARPVKAPARAQPSPSRCRAHANPATEHSRPATEQRRQHGRHERHGDKAQIADDQAHRLADVVRPDIAQVHALVDDDARIVAQAATFTLASTTAHSFDAFLESQGLGDCLTKYVIEAADVARVRDQLDLVGIDMRRDEPSTVTDRVLKGRKPESLTPISANGEPASV